MVGTVGTKGMYESGAAVGGDRPVKKWCGTGADAKSLSVSASEADKGPEPLPDGEDPPPFPIPCMRFRYSRYFWRCDATFSRVRPSTLMSCIIVFGTAFFIPRCATASTKRLWSCGVHTRRGRFRVRAGSSGQLPWGPLEAPADGSDGSKWGPEEGVRWVWREPGLGLEPGFGFGLEIAGISKARARSGVIRDWERGVRSSGAGSCSSHLANQLGSSSSLMVALFCWRGEQIQSGSAEERERERGKRRGFLGRGVRGGSFSFVFGLFC